MGQREDRREKRTKEGSNTREARIENAGLNGRHIMFILQR